MWVTGRITDTIELDRDLAKVGYVTSIMKENDPEMRAKMLYRFENNIENISRDYSGTEPTKSIMKFFMYT
jgi:hypothetical protein